MSSVVSTSCVMGGLRLPTTFRATRSQPAERIASVPAGHYAAPRPALHAAGFRQQQPGAEPSYTRATSASSSGFIRPDLPSVVGEEATGRPERPVNLEEVDMAKLSTMKLRNAGGSNAQMRSALEQASYMTNDVLWHEEAADKPQAKGYFGLPGFGL